MIWRYLPLTGALLLIAIALVWRPWLQYRRHGTFGIIVFRASNWQQYIRDGLAIAGFLLLIWQAARAAFAPDSILLLVDRSDTLLLVLNVIGAILLIGASVLLVASQLDLGASWRIGIEESARTGLVTEGLYRFSRNPIFAGLLGIVGANVLLVPTWLSIAVFAGACIGVRQQISAEEAYLLRSYGDEYRAYAQRVGRFVPELGGCGRD